MSASRNPAQAEIDTLQAVLTQALSKTHPDDMTTLAIESAKAVRAAFDELFKPITQSH